MRLFPGRQGRELNRIELALGVLLLALLAWLLHQRLGLLAARAEKTALETARAGLQSGLNLVLAERLLRGDRALLAALDKANPFELRARVCADAVQDCASGSVLSPPRGYLGAFAAAPPDWQGGEWYFNTLEGTLEYRLRHPQFVHGAPEPPRVRYQLRLLFDDRDGDGQPGPGEALHGARLQTLDRLHWTFDVGGAAP